jgi:hypothetical protein
VTTPGTTITPEGRRIMKMVILVGAALVATNLAAFAWQRLTGGGVVSGPNGSSYVTDGNGAAAFAELLEGLEVSVDRLRVPIRAGDPASSVTLAILDAGYASFGSSELSSLVAFVEGGGHLLVSGFANPDLFDALFGSELGWSPSGETTTVPAAVVAAAPGVKKVAGSGFGSFSEADGTEPLLVGDDKVVALTVIKGAGSITVIADPSILANDHIGLADNALLAVALTNGRSVVFDEYRHGFGGVGLFASLPGRWRTTLILAGVTIFIALLAYGRRLGPPESEDRDLAPERVRYVEALAGVLARTGDLDGAAAPIRRAARRRLLERSGLAVDLARKELARKDLEDATARLGLDPAEAASILDESNPDLLAAARALAKLTPIRPEGR